MIRWILGMILVAVAVSGVGTARADDEDGQRAWDAGRQSEALREWQAAANAGDAKAMLALGRLYVQGRGALQDFVKAHMWFNLAASRGEAAAVTERDALAARMAPEQVTKAQEQRAAWQPQPSASGLASPPQPKAIREAQELLAALGYEPDSPDGQWGERTAQAFQAFAWEANLPTTDTLTPAALQAMRTMARQAGAVSTPKPKAALPPDALHRAAKAGNLNGLEAALAAGMDVNARDDKGWTALMYVVDKGYVLLVEPLVQAKADPDVQAAGGATALFMAAAHGHGEIIELLMKAGADPTIKGPKNKTAMDLALLNLEKKKKDRWVSTLLTFRDCDQCPEMVAVPAGRFRMGNLSGDGDSDDRPVHDVTIDDPFAVGKYEVTFAEWDACVAAGGCPHRPDDEGWGRGARPVINVSWNDALGYVRWLSRKTDKPYRFLTAEEWQYVARAGTTTTYWWGNEIGTNKANCAGCGSRWDNRSTAPVGSFEANAFGVYDTAGNVWEWSANCWPENYAGVPADGSNWIRGWLNACKPYSDSAILHREEWGGAWGFSPEHLGSGIRYYIQAGNWDGSNNNGIRVARTLY